jgi:hypothetical protein
MGLWDDFKSGVRRVGSAIASAAKSAVGAVMRAGSAVVRATRSVVENIRNRAGDWETLLKKALVGAAKGGLAGFRTGGWVGALKGAAVGGFMAGYGEWTVQADAKQQAQDLQEDLDESLAAQGGAAAEALDELGGVLEKVITPLTRLVNSTEKIESMQELMRLEVALRFVVDLVNRIGRITSADEITVRDRRMVSLIHSFVTNKISDDELEEFDALLRDVYGKTLLLMGAERRVSLWTHEFNHNRNQIEKLRTLRHDMLVRIGELKSMQEDGVKTAEAQGGNLADLEKTHGQLESEFNELRAYQANLRLLTGCAEGLLQQAEAENAGAEMDEDVIERHDQAGAIMLNLEKKIDSLRDGELPLGEEERNFLEVYADLYMPGANERRIAVEVSA